MYENYEPLEPRTYRTGSTRPPKKRGCLFAFILIVLIFSIGIMSCLGLINIRLWRNIDVSAPSETLSIVVSDPEYETTAAIGEDLPIANKDSITQVIYNLLDNAVKFCPEGKTLGLRIREGGNKIYVSISNEGETIPPEELPLVFDRFHKLDKSRSKNRDGWGLGLYIVKTIVCSHGENISVTSRDGKTEFTFTMPLVN